MSILTLYLTCFDLIWFTCCCTIYNYLTQLYLCGIFPTGNLASRLLVLASLIIQSRAMCVLVHLYVYTFNDFHYYFNTLMQYSYVLYFHGLFYILPKKHTGNITVVTKFGQNKMVAFTYIKCTLKTV